MRDFLIVVLVLLMAGVLGVLVTGMVGLVRGGGDPRRSNKLMQWRVALQAAAILLLILIMIYRSNGLIAFTELNVRRLLRPRPR